MSARELVVLGTASQAPTRYRNHNGYLLRWDGEGVLFDPGEGTQRQFLLAGVPASAISRICLTHFHGDHCLGLPGILQRLSLDRVPQPVHAYFPASGQEYFDRLRYASAYHEVADIRPHPVAADGPVPATDAFTLVARRLDHPVDTYGWRLEEPHSRRMLPDRLAELGVFGRQIGRLQREGAVDVPAADGTRRVTLAEASEHRPGQRFAFVMDTGLCDAAFALAEDADLLVCEATFLQADAALAAQYRHLTAAQAARVAAESGARRLLLTHFSQRYPDLDRFLAEAREVFDDTVVAEDLASVPVPARR
jgi:ribonuclease Z